MKNQMVPSEAARNELREKIAARQPAPRANSWLRRALPMAACLLLAVVGILAVRQLRDPGGIVTPPPITATSIQNDGKITGLPISDTTPGDAPLSTADRSPFHSLESFFYQDELYGFALVRVTQIENTPPDASDRNGRQLSKLEVIEWASGAAEPAIVIVSQSRAGSGNDGYVISENYHSKLLRQGGVYLLPIGRFDWEGSDFWHVIGDMDALFEVDERGNIFSHSAIAAFAAYNGQSWQALMEDVRTIARDNPLLVQYPRFARMLRDEVPLAVIAILDGGTKGSSHLTQRVRAEQVLIQGTGRKWQVQLNEGEFSLNTYGHEAKALPGERYLAFIYGSEIEYSFQAENAARINADGTITPLQSEMSDRNVFDELVGMTVEQIQMLIEKAR